VIGAAVDPDRARADARDILGGRQFRSDPAPRPLRGPLRWMGDRIETVADFFGRLLAPIPWFVWLGIAVGLLALLVWWVVGSAERRRARTAAGPGDASKSAPPEDPAALEREADDAERRGEFERAVRLRFRAGLLRLGASGTIEYQPSISNGEVRQTLRSPTFDHLAADFDEIVYGGRRAGSPDAEEARARWPELVRGARR
jgi:hypothetical protein